MSATSLTLRGRARAEALMVDACAIVRRTGQTTDDLTGAVTPTTTAVYSGACKVQTAGAGSLGDRTDAGEVTRDVLRMELHLPVVGSETVARGDIVTITASALDPALVGRTLLIRDLVHKSYLTARRLVVEEVT